MSAPTQWKFVASFTDGEHFEFVPGHNIWDYKWTPVLRDPPPAPTEDEWKDSIAKYEIATVTDPLYGSTRQFRVYEITVDGRTIRFAASEFSNTVWGYYVPESDP